MLGDALDSDGDGWLAGSLVHHQFKSKEGKRPQLETPSGCLFVTYAMVRYQVVADLGCRKPRANARCAAA